MHVTQAVLNHVGAGVRGFRINGERTRMAETESPDSTNNLRSGFRLGPWVVLPDRGLLRDGKDERRLEPMVMDVLVALARRQGDVVSKDDLVREVWKGGFAADDTLVVKIRDLRKKLGDDTRNPTYIQTITKIGYRLKMPVTAIGPTREPTRPVYVSPRYVAAAVAVTGIALTAAWVWWPTPPPGPSLTCSPDPYVQSRYSLGQAFIDKRDLGSLQTAEEHFLETSRADPDCGRAYLWLAMTYLLLADYDPAARSDFYDRAVATADEGVRADRSVRREMGIVYGFVHHQYGRWAEAEEAYRVALRQPAIYSEVRHWYSRLLGDTGRLDEAATYAFDAQVRKPNSEILRSQAAAAFLWKDDMSRAREYFETTDAGGSHEHHFAHTLYLIRRNEPGDLDEARVSARRAVALLRADASWVDPVIDAIGNSTDEEAQSAALEMVKAMRRDGAPNYVVLTVLALLNQLDTLVDVAFEAASAEFKSDLAVIFMKEFDELHRDERFPDLLERLGLTEFWGDIDCNWSGSRVVCD